MKNIAEYMNESLEVETPNVNEELTSEDDFRKAARAKFEKAFGDDLDEDKMNSVIDGLIKNNKEDADAGNWAKLMGMLNKSFGK